MGEDISKEYGKKFRDLLTALKNDENTELREGLLLGKIQPEEFVKYERDQLIPKSLMQLREQSQRKYFQENVQLDSDKPIQVVMKSHKGEETRQLYPSGQSSAVESEPPKTMYVSKEPEINYLEELREKWCIKKLQKRFEERIQNYIICDNETKVQLLDHLEKLKN